MAKKTYFSRYWKAGCLVLGLAILIPGCVLSLFLLEAVSAAPRSFSITPTEAPAADAYILSKEQQTLIDQLGYPDAFIIQFYREDQPDQGQQDMRLEIWSYYLAGQEVTLLNGQVIDRIDVDVSTGPLSPMPYRPQQFDGTMDASAVLHASGLQEYIQAPLETEGVPGGILFFGEQIVFGFQDDKLLYVESFALEGGVQP